MKNLILLVLLISTQSYAQSDAQEEALILNQELDFLQSSAKNVTDVSKPLGESEDRMISDTPTRGRTTDENLERTYFGEDELDTVRTRTAAPKRRIFRR